MAIIAPVDANQMTHKPKENFPMHCNHDLSSQTASEGTTRGIFEWLRSTGYPANEKPIYQHSWIGIESSDDEEGDDVGSDIGKRTDSQAFIDEWLTGVD